MSTVNLTPVSYVVLGLIARDGPSTPYELKVATRRGIAHFWPFPHSQLYAESERLAAAGLLEEEREEGGRRRRRYALTDAGRAALATWLAEPVDDVPQLRSLGLLKLFFGQFAADGDMRALAAAQAAAHRERLASYYPAAEERLAARPDRAWQLEVLHAIRDTERVLLRHWSTLAGE